MHRHLVADWLRQNVSRGDLVLSGSTDPLSRLIRWGTLSDYSHAALALDNDCFVESYDWSGTPAGDDDGVAVIPVDQYARRGRLLRLALLRPTDLDHDRFYEVAVRATHYSPTFPSTAGLMLGLAGLGDHPRFQIPALRSFLGKRLHLLGDGAARVTCSELAARVYLEAGLPLHFQTIRLIHYAELLRHGDWAPLDADGEPRTVETKGRREQDRASLVAYVAGLPHALRATSRESTKPDWADLLVPGDFLHSSSFRLVAKAEIR